ncbi:MAG: hypothetical protein SNJ29_14675 [Rikenellaceae bacterium]
MIQRDTLQIYATTQSLDTAVLSYTPYKATQPESTIFGLCQYAHQHLEQING